MPFFALLLLFTLPAVAAIDFATQVQPILSGSCYACHGPDTAANEGGLRLDQRDLALRGGHSGPAIVPGDARASLLVQRFSLAPDDDEHMPPAHKKDPLTSKEKATLVTWINEGARWGSHWAFLAPKRPTIPEVQNSSWPKNEIDHFILARLEASGLSPSSPAPARTILRRLHLDLTGLPPSPAQLSSFRPEELNARVEELLSSPHYGEKWAREWLDAARYADSSGYEKDLLREMHFYRDWVVQALNEDMGYDDFVIRQIAGDLLPGATTQDILATGYLRNSMTNEEGGIKPEQFRIEGLFDRVDAIGKGILGLTTQCAQCHTHKYDPLTHDEYYGLFAYLNSIREASLAAYPDADLAKIHAIQEAVARSETLFKSQHPGWTEDFQRWQDELRALPRTEWEVQKMAQTGDSGQKYQNLPDHSLINQGFAATRGTFPFDHEPPTIQSVKAVRLELLNDPYLPLDGPGRSREGTFALSEYQLHAGPSGQKTSKQNFASAVASVNPPDAGPENLRTGSGLYAIDGKTTTAWTNDLGPGRSNDPQVLILTLAAPIENAHLLHLHSTLTQNHGHGSPDNSQSLNPGRFRLSFSSSLPNDLDSLPPLVLEALFAPQRTPTQKARLFRHWASTQPSFQPFREEIEKHWSTHPRPTLALVARAAATPRTTNLFKRGEQSKPAHEVRPHVPAFLHPLPDGPPESRLTFARWLVDRRSPTTARALVNRVWQSYFGTGLVTTPEDFGLQSPSPSHPGLLDWLAVEVMENNWRMKDLHRLIVSSATYQQASTHPSLLQEKDPRNRLLARGPRLRLPAESIRDLHLAASGLLNPALGGRSVFPPAPAFLFQRPVSFGPKVWKTEPDDQRYRRALYTFRYRSVPYPMLAAFDAPSGESSCVRRTVSTTPLQALTTLNEALSVEVALALGSRILDESIATAFEHCTSRPPRPDELAILETLFLGQKSRITPEDAAALLKAHLPVTLAPDRHDPVTWAAATSVAQALLNLDETLTKN